jgi:hypothetical protein
VVKKVVTPPGAAKLFVAGSTAKLRPVTVIWEVIVLWASTGKAERKDPINTRNLPQKPLTIYIFIDG